MKFSYKFRLSAYVEKNINFSFCFKLFWGLTKFEALQKAFVMKLNPPKPSPHTRKPTCGRPQVALHGRRWAPGRSPRPADGPRSLSTACGQPQAALHGQRTAPGRSPRPADGLRTFLAPKWPLLSLVPFKGPKKSQPTLKVSILTRGHLKEGPKSLCPL